MDSEFRIRQLRKDDDVLVETLYARTRNPYLQEDAAQVSAMHARAHQARDIGHLWSPARAETRTVSDAEQRASWVAEPLSSGPRQVIGTVGLRIVGDDQTADADTVETNRSTSVDEWMRTADVGEVRRLRVAPEWRRRGVATALMRELISWSTRSGLRTLVLNTTAAQLPALGAIP